MENFDLTEEEKLQIEVNRLKKENQFLKEEIRRLNSMLTGINTKRTIEDINGPIANYYLARYNEIHEFVFNNRVIFLDDEIKKAELEYQTLREKEDKLGEIAKNNEVLLEQINVLNNKLEENSAKLKEATDTFNSMADDVTELENNIYDSTISYYNNLLTKFSIGNMDETLTYMNFVIDVLEYNMYQEVVKYQINAKKALAILDELNDLEFNIREENSSYERKKAELEAHIENISFEETEQKLDNLATEIINKKKVKEELTTLFEELKNKNVKSIKDEIAHLQILEYSNQQLALKMDEMILEFKTTLANVDTVSNILLHKEAKLKKLQAELDTIMPFKEAYDKTSSEYNTLLAMHKTTSDNIEEIESYVSKAKKVFDANTSFKKTLMDYDEAKVKLVSLKERLDSYRLREKNLMDTRRQVLADPYGKNNLIRIDEELSELQSDIARFDTEYTSVNNFIRTISETEQDRKLIMIHEDCIKCEEELIPLYEKVRSLAAYINDKYVEVNELKNKCSKYDELISQIEDVENEINNI